MYAKSQTPDRDDPGSGAVVGLGVGLEITVRVMTTGWTGGFGGTSNGTNPNHGAIAFANKIDANIIACRGIYWNHGIMQLTEKI